MDCTLMVLLFLKTTGMGNVPKANVSEWYP
jgi:hypothetical protein